MIYRIFPIKDTFITNALVNGTRHTGSNCGGSEILDLYKRAAVSGSTGILATASLARVLIAFDLSDISAMTASSAAPSSGITYSLRMRHVTHGSTLPSSYDINILPMSRAWDEGAGLDNDLLMDPGYANWINAKSTVAWTTPGGDYLTSTTASVHIDTGTESVDVDVTPMVNAWLTGGLANNGIMLKILDAQEAGTNYIDYYLKRFYGRASNFTDRRPYLEARWDDSLKDDRADMVYGSTGTLFLYNMKWGQLTALPVGPGFPIVRIVDASGTLATLTGSYTGTPGLYSASLALPTGSYSGSVFHDLWGSGSFTFLTGTFGLTNEQPLQGYDTRRYVVKMRNLSPEYSLDDSPVLRVSVRDQRYAPTTVMTASLIQPTVVRKAYYRVENDATREQVVQFGTGSALETTRLSYDRSGNYFKLPMINFHPGNVYKIVFLFDDSGERQIIDGGFKFKVV